MMGGAKGHYECISGFIQEDYSADLKKISVPALLMNGEADQNVPCATSGPRAVELVQAAGWMGGAVSRPPVCAGACHAALLASSIAAVMAEFSAAGFVVDALAEARPTPAAVTRFPEELTQLMDTPSFIVHRLRLAPPE